MAYGGPVPETPVSPAETRIYIAFGPALRERWSIPEGKSFHLDLPRHCTVLGLKQRIMEGTRGMLPVCQQRLRFLNRSEELEDYIDAGNANTSTHRCIETVLEVEHDEILELDRVPDVPHVEPPPRRASGAAATPRAASVAACGVATDDDSGEPHSAHCQPDARPEGPTPAPKTPGKQQRHGEAGQHGGEETVARQQGATTRRVEGSRRGWAPPEQAGPEPQLEPELEPEPAAAARKRQRREQVQEQEQPRKQRRVRQQQAREEQAREEQALEEQGAYEEPDSDVQEYARRVHDNTDVDEEEGFPGPGAGARGKARKENCAWTVGEVAGLVTGMERHGRSWVMVQTYVDPRRTPMHCTDKWKTLVKAAKRQWKQGRAETKRMPQQLKARVEALMVWLGEAGQGGAAQAQASASEGEGPGGSRPGAGGKKRKENCPWVFEEMEGLVDGMEQHGKEWTKVQAWVGSRHSPTECREKWENLVKGGDAQYKNARGETKKLDEGLVRRLDALMAKHMTAAQHAARQQRAHARAHASAAGPGAGAAARKENCAWTVEEVERLVAAMEEHGKAWVRVEAAMGGERKQIHCKDKWRNLLEGLKRGWDNARRGTTQFSPELKRRVEKLRARLQRRGVQESDGGEESDRGVESDC